MGINKIGLLTYHAAYNYGSVLQAFATQKVIQNLGYDVSIINYRTDEQKKYYKSIVRTSYGVRFLLKELMRLPALKKRYTRNRKFEQFITERMNLTKEVRIPEEVYAIWDNFDVVVSGSDQIWNKHSFELENADWEFMAPYLLKGYNGKKISYGSSLPNMSSDEINKIIPYLFGFDYIACREDSTSLMLSERLHREIDSVLDPTLLLNKKDWLGCFDIPQEQNEGNYILYYTLINGTKAKQQMIKRIEHIAKQVGCDVLVLSPSSVILNHGKNTRIIEDAGPEDFLRLINGSRFVFTDSYHGTAFSVNFCKPFICLGLYGNQVRQLNLLKKLGIEDRIISSIGEIDEDVLNREIDFQAVDLLLSEHRAKSLQYLRYAIEQ